MDGSVLVRNFWEYIRDRQWSAAYQLLAPSFTVEWPHSRDRIRGAHNYIELNRLYPEPWMMQITAVHETTSKTVAAEIHVSAPGANSHCCAIFTVDTDRILFGTEYWVDDDHPRPEWRREFVEYY